MDSVTFHYSRVKFQVCFFLNSKLNYVLIQNGQNCQNSLERVCLTVWKSVFVIYHISSCTYIAMGCMLLSC